MFKLLRKLSVLALGVVFLLGAVPSDSAEQIRIKRGKFKASAAGEAITGLDWPSNGEGSTRFRFTGAALPTIQPLTIIWKINPTQQTGYYTTFFWAEDSFTFFNDDVSEDPYFGCHPYPQGGAGGNVHNWEISMQGADDIVDENGNNTTVTKGQWYSQAAVASLSSDVLTVSFYWNLTVSTNRIIQRDTTDSWGDGTGWTSPALTFGDAPWSLDAEQMSSIFRGLQIYQAVLNTTQILALSDCDTNACVASTASAQGVTPWYYNMNPTPSDISDKSGNGHHPGWVGANRPASWSQ
jgi:hypothetical protein